jgi:hypothetical protein
MIARVALALFLLIGSAPAFGANPEGQYLFDLLKQQHYLTAWKAMLKGETVPAWVKNYASTFDGPSNPSTAVPIGNEVYTLGYVCQAHNCGGNELYVLFAPGGAQAWGLLITGEDRKWLGNPDAAIQAAILSGVQ